MPIKAKGSNAEPQKRKDTKKADCPFDSTTLRNIEAVEEMSKHPLSNEELVRQTMRNSQADYAEQGGMLP